MLGDLGDRPFLWCWIFHIQLLRHRVDELHECESPGFKMLKLVHDLIQCRGHSFSILAELQPAGKSKSSMSLYQRRPASLPEKEVDESIYRPRELNRMELPAEDMTFYQEIQSFDHIWLWAVMGIELIILMTPLIVTGQPLWVIAIA